MGQRCLQICFKDLSVCCFGSQWQTEWRWLQTAHFHDVQLKRRPFPFPITALTCLEICPCKFLRVTHDLHWYLEKEQQQQPCALLRLSNVVKSLLTHSCVSQSLFSFVVEYPLLCWPLRSGKSLVLWPFQHLFFFFPPEPTQFSTDHGSTAIS